MRAAIPGISLRTDGKASAEGGGGSPSRNEPSLELDGNAIFACAAWSGVAIAEAGEFPACADRGAVMATLQTGHSTCLPANESAACTRLPQFEQMNSSISDFPF